VKLKSLLPDARATELLRAMLLDGDAARDAWSRWRARVSDPMRALGEDTIMARPLLPLLYDSVRRNGLPVDDALATYLRSAFLTESLRSRKYREIVAELLALVDGAVLIKGAAIGELYYVDPTLRHAHDIEILTGNPAAVRASLIGSRFRPSGEHFVHESGLPLRVHENPAIGQDATFHLAYTLTHAARSPSRHSARWACDAFMIVRNASVDWSRLTELVPPITAAAQLHWLRDALGVNVSADVIATLNERARAASASERAAVRRSLAVGEVGWWRRVLRRLRLHRSAG
jgi:hypothetical protein